MGSGDGLFGAADDANTPLAVDEQKDLMPVYITTRAQLNQAEQLGIIEADRWAFSRRRDVLDASFLCQLHRRMFKDVWRWAGQYRKTAKNIGTEAYRIPTEVVQLTDDVRFWIEHESYEADEVAIRFHHRLVQIHPFPNGNGRHARLAADLLVQQLNRPRFSWGAQLSLRPDQVRQAYISALRLADRHDLASLLAFARS